MNNVFKTLVIFSVFAISTGCGIQDDGDTSVTPDAPECTEDSDCGENEVCDDSNVCVGEYTPECTSDNDCAEGQVCEDDACVAAPEPTPECTVDSDCGENAYCQGNTCHDVAPPAPECTEDVDCGEGRVCTDGECADAPVVDTAPECTEDSDCADGNVCVDEVCVEEVVEPEPEFLPELVKAWSECDDEGNCDCTLGFSAYYADGAMCGEVRGAGLPGVSWEEGAFMTESDNGYMLATFTAEELTEGEIQISYQSSRTCEGTDGLNDWANFGAPDQLAQMSPEGRDFIWCSWIDDPDTDNPHCQIRANVVKTTDDGVTSCSFEAAGNAR